MIQCRPDHTSTLSSKELRDAADRVMNTLVYDDLSNPSFPGNEIPPMQAVKSKKIKQQDRHQDICNARSVIALTEAQRHYILSIQSKIITFGVGPAGTGKTFVAAAMACEQFANKSINRIIVTRPVVETGRSLGALPGTLGEKFSPYIAPLYEVMQQHLGKSQLEYALKAGQIRALPLEFMRGMSFDDTWVILDEAQNSTPEQMLMLLTRIGQNCKLIVNGDPAQSDLRMRSGLDDALNKLEGIPDVGMVEFDLSDIVRSGIVKKILTRYHEKE